MIRALAFIATVILRAGGLKRDEANTIVNEALSDWGLSL